MDRGIESRAVEVLRWEFRHNLQNRPTVLCYRWAKGPDDDDWRVFLLAGDRWEEEQRWKFSDIPSDPPVGGDGKWFASAKEAYDLALKDNAHQIEMLRDNAKWLKGAAIREKKLESEIGKHSAGAS